MKTNAEISTGLEEIKQMLLGMQQRNKEFWDEQVIQIRSLRHSFNQTAAELSGLQTLMAEPTEEIENPGSVETPVLKNDEDDSEIYGKGYDIEDDLSAVAEEKFVGLPAVPSSAVVKVQFMPQYNFFIIDNIAECMEVCPIPSNYSEKTLEKFCTPDVCINVPMDMCSQLTASLSLSCTSHNFAGLKCVDSIHHGLDKPPPLPPEITYGFASNNLGLLINLMLGSFKNQKLAHDLGTSYLKAKDAQVDEFLLYENTNSDMNKQYYLTLMSDCLAGIVILFEKCKILEVKPSNLSQSQFVHQIINEPMKVVCTDSLGGSIQLEFFLFSALKPPEFTVLQLNLSFFFVGFQSADLIHIELHKPPPLPPDPEYAYGFDTVLWQAVISTNILFEVTVEKESSDLIELTNPEQQLSSSKLIVEFDALIGRRGKRLLVGQNFDIYQLTEFVKTGFGGEVGLKLGCVVDGHLKVNDKRQKKKGIGGSTVDSQCFLKSAAPEINGWKNFTRSGWPGVSDNLQRLTGWENRRLQLPNYTFLNRYRALDAVQQPLKNRWLDQLVEVGYYDVGRVRRPLAQMQDQTHSGFFMSISQVEHHLTYGNSRYESSMNNMIVKDKITGVVSQFYVNATGAVSQSYVNAIVATVKIKCTIQCVGWSFIGFVIVKLLTLRTRSFSKRRGMLQEGISSYLRIVRVK